MQHATKATPGSFRWSEKLAFGLAGHSIRALCSIPSSSPSPPLPCTSLRLRCTRCASAASHSPWECPVSWPV